jgi:hypothetical protein
MSSLPTINEYAVSANKFRPIWILVLVVWMAAVVSGMWALDSYKITPGRVGRTPLRISDETTGALAAGRPRLLMFVHPKCPCSRASLSELAAIVERNRERVAVEIVFVKPAGVGADWERTSLWRTATQIAGAHVVFDDGTLARKLGAETSGYVVLYDASGSLLFSGGITRSRGHEGRSVGSRTIGALLAGEAVANPKTPVFGCSLFARGNCDGSDKSGRPKAIGNQ